MRLHLCLLLRVLLHPALRLHLCGGGGELLLHLRVLLHLWVLLHLAHHRCVLLCHAGVVLLLLLLRLCLCLRLSLCLPLPLLRDVLAGVLGMLWMLRRDLLLSLPLPLDLARGLLRLRHLGGIGHRGAGSELGSLHHRAVARSSRPGGGSSLSLRVGHGTAWLGRGRARGLLLLLLQLQRSLMLLVEVEVQLLLRYVRCPRRTGLPAPAPCRYLLEICGVGHLRRVAPLHGRWLGNLWVLHRGRRCGRWLQGSLDVDRCLWNLLYRLGRRCWYSRRWSLLLCGGRAACVCDWCRTRGRRLCWHWCRPAAGWGWIMLLHVWRYRKGSARRGRPRGGGRSRNKGWL